MAQEDQPIENGMKTCPGCKATIPVDSSVCPSCGIWVGENLKSLSKKNLPAEPQRSIEDQQKRNKTIILAVAIGFLFLCILVGVSVRLLTQKSNKETVEKATQENIQLVRTETAQVVETQGSKSTREALPTFETQLAMTQRAGASLATKTSEPPISLLNRARDWPEHFSDHFSLAANGWYTGTDEDQYSKGEWKISNGKYEISLQAKDAFSQWMWPTLTSSLGENFYLASRLDFQKGPDGMDGGLIFRLSEDVSFYLFDIFPTGDFMVYRHQPGKWDALIDSTHSDNYKAGLPNLLEVIGQGNYYVLFLNDELLASFSDDVLQQGNVGLEIGLPAADDAGMWVFDDFVVKMP